jgi:hypothetical protein
LFTDQRGPPDANFRTLIDGYEARKAASAERIAQGRPAPGDVDDDSSDDESWINQATENYAKQQRGDFPSTGEAKFVNLNDQIDDFDVTPKKAADIQRTLSLLRRMRGELYLVEGQWLLARQLHTEQFRLMALESPAAASDPSSNAPSNYLDLVFANKNGPQRDMVSNEVVELTRKMMRECNVPGIRNYLSDLGKDEKILAIKFNSMQRP